ncbi:hypothetical protein Tco_0085389 [Tanacetum coccineum]
MLKPTTKYPIIDWEIYSKGARKYWKIIRVGNHTEVYQFFDDMLKLFDREELVKLTPSEIDDIIYVELPSPTDDPAGYKVPFLAETFLDEEGYPHYRRRDNKLSFHLPNQNTITLRDSKNLPALLQREGIDVKMFTDWFELNKHDPAARTHTYADIPKHYVWHEQKKLWLPRKQRKCIDIIVYSIPASGERYYLRMLLNVVRGVTGFEHLMTVNHRLYATFKEVCFAYGLLNDDREWTKALSEASLWALGPQLHDIFITMLLFCDVARPLKLWETNWQALSENILHKKWKLYKYPELQLMDE